MKRRLKTPTGGLKMNQATGNNGVAGEDSEMNGFPESENRIIITSDKGSSDRKAMLDKKYDVDLKKRIEESEKLTGN
jgi:hypothetical protein